MDNIDESLLIELIEARPHLYDKAHPKYMDKNLRNQSYQYIALVLEIERK